jgi:anti-sigma factor RsiW
MIDPRLMHLLKRELDGELTPIEAEELERLCLSSPEARAERRAWRRMQASLRSTIDSEALDVDALAAKLSQRRVRPEARSRRLPAAVACASILVLVAALWRDHRPPIAPAPEVRPEISAKHDRAPVELRLEERSVESGLVVIRF